MQDFAFDYAAGIQAMDQEILEIIGQAFVEQWPADMQSLRAHVQAHEPQPVLHTAHALKGTLAMFGADPASQLAARVEALATRGDLEAVDLLLPALVAEVDHLLHALQRSLSS
jgi:HPt (histidine-containing phosphotransfer) domain-containing protein